MRPPVMAAGPDPAAGPVPAEAIAALPKVELHVHLEGSMRPSTVLALAKNNDVDIGLESEEELAARYRFRDFLHFIELFKAGLAVIRTPDDYVTFADALTDELAAQNVRHAEITTTPVNHVRTRGWGEAEYAAALDEAQRRAAAKGVSVGWILDISRGDELPEDQLTAGLIDGAHAPPALWPWASAGPRPSGRPSSTPTTSPAPGPPASPRWCTPARPPGPRACAAPSTTFTRYGSAMASGPWRTRPLVGRLADEQVPIEVSPTSNVLLIPHVDRGPPDRRHGRAGLNVSVNTDDPGYFSTDLTRELRLVTEHHGFDAGGSRRRSGGRWRRRSPRPSSGPHSSPSSAPGSPRGAGRDRGGPAGPG